MTPRLPQIMALGARTPVGLTAESAAAAARARVSRIREHPFMVDERGQPVCAAIDPRLDSRLQGWERLVPMAASAAGEAIRKLGTAVARQDEVLVALPEARPGFSDADAQKVIAALGRDEAVGGLRVSLAGRGHAGALEAMRLAADKLAAGQAEVCVVVGVDSYLQADTLDWLTAHGQLDGEGVRNGFTPGEAAGAVVLAGQGAQRYLRLPALATVRGLHTAMETRLIKSDDDVLGEGLGAAIGGAVARLKLPEEAIDAVYCDLNGERYRTDEWGFAVMRQTAAFRRLSYVTAVTSWGDVGAASGALAVILAVQAWGRRHAPGPRALVWASSEGGLRGAVVLQQVGG